MEVRATLLPGQDGTKQLQKLYGEQLVCVRYRYDKQNKRRLKTVELIIEDTPWVNSIDANVRRPPPKKRTVEQTLLRVGFHETELRQKVKQAGGIWLKQEKLWRLPYSRVVELIDADDLGF
jgi:hypothetical protein